MLFRVRGPLPASLSKRKPDHKNPISCLWSHQNTIFMCNAKIGISTWFSVKSFSKNLSRSLETARTIFKMTTRESSVGLTVNLVPCRSSGITQ